MFLLFFIKYLQTTAKKEKKISNNEEDREYAQSNISIVPF